MIGVSGWDRFKLLQAPEQYPDAKSQPHVQVALKMIKDGEKVRPGDAIQYIVCVGSSDSTPLYVILCQLHISHTAQTRVPRSARTLRRRS